MDRGLQAISVLVDCLQRPGDVNERARIKEFLADPAFSDIQVQTTRTTFISVHDYLLAAKVPAPNTSRLSLKLTPREPATLAPLSDLALTVALSRLSRIRYPCKDYPDEVLCAIQALRSSLFGTTVDVDFDKIEHVVLAHLPQPPPLVATRGTQILDELCRAACRPIRACTSTKLDERRTAIFVAAKAMQCAIELHTHGVRMSNLACGLLRDGVKVLGAWLCPALEDDVFVWVSHASLLLPEDSMHVTRASYAWLFEGGAEELCRGGQRVADLDWLEAQVLVARCLMAAVTQNEATLSTEVATRVVRQQLDEARTWKVTAPQDAEGPGESLLDALLFGGSRATSPDPNPSEEYSTADQDLLALCARCCAVPSATRTDVQKNFRNAIEAMATILESISTQFVAYVGPESEAKHADSLERNNTEDEGGGMFAEMFCEPSSYTGMEEDATHRTTAVGREGRPLTTNGQLEIANVQLELATVLTEAICLMVANLEPGTQLESIGRSLIWALMWLPTAKRSCSLGGSQITGAMRKLLRCLFSENKRFEGLGCMPENFLFKFTSRTKPYLRQYSDEVYIAVILAKKSDGEFANALLHNFVEDITSIASSFLKVNFAHLILLVWALHCYDEPKRREFLTDLISALEDREPLVQANEELAMYVSSFWTMVARYRNGVPDKILTEAFRDPLSSPLCCNVEAEYALDSTPLSQFDERDDVVDFDSCRLRGWMVREMNSCISSRWDIALADCSSGDGRRVPEALSRLWTLHRVLAGSEELTDPSGPISKAHALAERPPAVEQCVATATGLLEKGHMATYGDYCLADLGVRLALRNTQMASRSSGVDSVFRVSILRQLLNGVQLANIQSSSDFCARQSEAEALYRCIVDHFDHERQPVPPQQLLARSLGKLLKATGFDPHASSESLANGAELCAMTLDVDMELHRVAVSALSVGMKQSEVESVVSCFRLHWVLSTGNVSDLLSFFEQGLSNESDLELPFSVVLLGSSEIDTATAPPRCTMTLILQSLAEGADASTCDHFWHLFVQLCDLRKRQIWMDVIRGILREAYREMGESFAACISTFANSGPSFCEALRAVDSYRDDDFDWALSIIDWSRSRIVDIFNPVSLESYAQAILVGAIAARNFSGFNKIKVFVDALAAGLGRLEDLCRNGASSSSALTKGRVILRCLVLLCAGRKASSFEEIPVLKEVLGLDLAEESASSTDTARDSKTENENSEHSSEREHEEEEGDREEEADGEEDYDYETGSSGEAPSDVLMDENIDSKCCTFTTTGNQFVEQHWYFCYSCGLTGSEGICGICARVCHRGHEVAYSRMSRFFCDCGAAAVISAAVLESGEASRSGTLHVCEALRPRSARITSDHPDTLSGSLLSDFDHELVVRLSDAGRSANDLVEHTNVRRALFELSRTDSEASLAENDIEGLLKESSQSKAVIRGLRGIVRYLKIGARLQSLLASENLVAETATTARSRKSLRPGAVFAKRPSFDSSIPVNLLASESTGRVAFIDGKKVVFADASQLLRKTGQESIEKNSLRVLTQIDLGGPLRWIQFHPLNNCLLLAGSTNSCNVILIGERGEVLNNIAINFRIEENEREIASNPVVDMFWVRAARSSLVVATTKTIKVYNAFVDTLVPTHCIVGKDAINAVAEVEDTGRAAAQNLNAYGLVVATNTGQLFGLSMSETTTGPLDLQDGIELLFESDSVAVRSLAFVPWLRSLVVCFDEGVLLFGRISEDRRKILQWTRVHVPNSAPRLACSWEAPGFLVMPCTRPGNACIVLRIGMNTVEVGQVPAVESESSRCVGLSMSSSSSINLSREPCALVLTDDGSLARMELLGTDGVGLMRLPRKITSIAAVDDENEKLRELAGPEHTRVPSAIGLFERSRSVTNHLVFDGDVLQCDNGMSSEAVLSTLTGTDSPLVALRPDEPLRISMRCTKERFTLVGARVLVGSTERSRTRVPSSIQVFGRLVPVKLTAGTKRWVDIAFSPSESESSPSAFVLELLPPRDEAGDGCVAVDMLEVYAMNSQDFADRARVQERRADLNTQSGRRTSSASRASSLSLEFEKEVIALTKLVVGDQSSNPSTLKALRIELNDQFETVFRLMDEKTLCRIQRYKEIEESGSAQLATDMVALDDATVEPLDFELLVCHNFALSEDEEVLTRAKVPPETAGRLFNVFRLLGPSGREVFVDPIVTSAKLVVALWNVSTGPMLSEIVLLLTCFDRNTRRGSCLGLSSAMNSERTASNSDHQIPTVARCANCEESCGSVVWTCVVCAEVVLCSTCVESDDGHNPEHFFRRASKLTDDDERHGQRDRFQDIASIVSPLFTQHSPLGIELDSAAGFFSSSILSDGLSETQRCKRFVTLLERNLFIDVITGDLVDRKDLAGLQRGVLLLQLLAGLFESPAFPLQALAQVLFEHGLMKAMVRLVEKSVAILESANTEELVSINTSRENQGIYLNDGFDSPYASAPIVSGTIPRLYLATVYLDSIVRVLTNAMSCVSRGKASVLHEELVSALYSVLFAQSRMSAVPSTATSPLLASSFRNAKRLLLELFAGNKLEYNTRLDEAFLTRHVAKLTGVANKSGELESVSYEQKAELADALNAMVTIMEKRPFNWRQFCSQTLRDENFLELLCRIGCTFSGSLQLCSFRLLAVAYASNADSAVAAVAATGANEETRKRKDQYPTATPSTIDANPPAKFLLKSNMRVLSTLMSQYLLLNQSPFVRMSIYYLVRGVMTMVMERGEPGLLEELQETFLQSIGGMSLVGRLSSEFSELLADSIREMGDPKYCQDMARVLLAMFRSANQFLAAHPNLRIYRALRRVIHVDGFFLVSEPCLSCASSSFGDASASEHNLDNLKAESKYTDSSIFVRLLAPHAVSRISVKIVEPRKSRKVKKICVHFSSRVVAEASELKASGHPWRLLHQVCFEQNQSHGHVELSLPVVAANLMIDFVEFYPEQVSITLGNDRLQCPRCSRPVSDRHGICRNCRENAYQCRQCRNINYENLDAFLCNECGYSKHGRFEFLLTATPSFAAERIESETDRRRTLDLIERGTAVIHSRYEQMKTLRESIVNTLSSFDNDAQVSRPVVDERKESKGHNDKNIVYADIAALVFGSHGGTRTIGRQDPETSAEGRIHAEGQSDISSSELRSRVNGQVISLASMYGRDCRSLFVSMSYGIQILRSMRRELVRYASCLGGQRSIECELNDCNAHVLDKEIRCFGCAQEFLSRCLGIMDLLVQTRPDAKDIFVDEGLGLDLLKCTVAHDHSERTRELVRTLICKLVCGSAGASDSVCRAIRSKLELCIDSWDSMDIEAASRIEIMVLDALIEIDDDCWEDRLRMILGLLFYAAPKAEVSASISEQILLPCIRAVVRLSGGDDDASDVDLDVEDLPIGTLNYDAWASGSVSFSSWAASTVESDPGTSRRKPVSVRSSSSDDLSWAVQLLIRSPNSAVRSQVGHLLEVLCRGSRERCLRLVDVLIGSPLTIASSVDEDAKEFFDLLSKLTVPLDRRVHAASSGLLSRLTLLIEREGQRLQQSENSFAGFDLSQGYCLRRMAELLKTTLHAVHQQQVLHLLEQESPDIVPRILRSFLSVRKLIAQQTKLTDESQLILLEALQDRRCLGERKEVLQCYLEEVLQAEENEDQRTLIILLEQMCAILCPEREQPEYELVLNKAPTQEEFIRGNLSRSPYLSSNIGPLMRDVKNKICTDLELTGLLEDDFGMELLVAGNLIKLDLAVESVYEHVWRRSRDASVPTEAEEDLPMIIVYRLSGLDGEATEPIIDTLPTCNTDEIDPEEEFRATIGLCERGGMDVLLRLVQRASVWSEAECQVSGPALRLLRACCEVGANRKRLANRGVAVAGLLDCAAKAFLSDQPSAASAAESLLLVSEKLLAEIESSSSQSGLEMTTDPFDSREILTRLEVFLNRLEIGSSKAEGTLLRVLPFLTQGLPEAVGTVLDYFTSRFDIGTLDGDRDGQRLLKQLVHVMNSAPSESKGDIFRRNLVERNVCTNVLERISVYFPYPRKSRSSEWSQSLEQPGPPLLLQLLTAVIGPITNSERFAMRRIVEDLETSIPTLVSLETVASSGAVGSLAEELVEALRENDKLKLAVDQTRRKAKDARKEAAEASRAAVLKENGITQDVSGSLNSGMDSRQASLALSIQPDCIDMEGIEEEVGPACVVCGDGFRSRPEEVLSVYVYSKKMSLPLKLLYPVALSTSEGDKEKTTTFYSSLTYFNSIHPNCHKEAYRMERSLRVPRDEWEGATLRNSQTSCNNMLPVCPPAALKEILGEDKQPLAKAAAADYANAVEQYFLRLSALGRTFLSHFQMVVADIAVSLDRFALRDTSSFSEETNGGGAHSNASLLPHMVGLALYLLTSSGRRDSSFGDAIDKWPTDNGSSNASFALALSLCLDDFSTWCDRAAKLLAQALIECRREGSGRSTKDVLVLFSFTHNFQALLKAPLPGLGDEYMAMLQRRIVRDDLELVDGVRCLVEKYENSLSNISSVKDFLQAMSDCSGGVLPDGFVESLAEKAKEVEIVSK